jgi:hypothetical protein
MHYERDAGDRAAHLPDICQTSIQIEFIATQQCTSYGTVMHGQLVHVLVTFSAILLLRCRPTGIAIHPNGVPQMWLAPANSQALQLAASGIYRLLKGVA